MIAKMVTLRSTIAFTILKRLNLSQFDEKSFLYGELGCEGSWSNLNDTFEGLPTLCLSVEKVFQ